MIAMRMGHERGCDCLALNGREDRRYVRRIAGAWIDDRDAAFADDIGACSSDSRASPESRLNEVLLQHKNKGPEALRGEKGLRDLVRRPSGKHEFGDTLGAGFGLDVS